MIKDDTLTKVKELESRLRDLAKDIRKINTKYIAKKELRDRAEQAASYWIEVVRSPLEHKFKIPKEVIEKYAAEFRKLHVLSRPNNRKSSYESCLKNILKQYKDDLELHLMQSTSPIESDAVLDSLLGKITEQEISAYLNEAVLCARAGHNKAAIVIAWCAVVDTIQQKILRLGFEKFNLASKAMKAQNSGRFKRFTKEFSVTTLSELQEVFDNDLLWVTEYLGLIDSNQSERLRVCFQYRNNSAHPGYAPIQKVHMHAFFSDIVDIVLSNKAFNE